MGKCCAYCNAIRPWPTCLERKNSTAVYLVIHSHKYFNIRKWILDEIYWLNFDFEGSQLWPTMQIHRLYSVQLLTVLRLPLPFGCTQSSWWLCAVNGCNHFKIQPKKVPISIFYCACTNICPFKVGSFKVICHTFYHTLCNLKLQ